MRDWLSQFPFTVDLAIRSAIYAVIIAVLQWLQPGEFIAGLPTHGNIPNSGTAFSIALSYRSCSTWFLDHQPDRGTLVPQFHHRAFCHHTPVEENRFVLFVDIAGSTGLAEQLGGVGIHRFLDRTFRLLTDPVVDYRGEVLNYIGDEVIVTWPERSGAIESRPLRCFAACAGIVARGRPVRKRIRRGAQDLRSRHYGPVIVGEIGDVKRAIVFNGDVMNTAAGSKSEPQVDGGFWPRARRWRASIQRRLLRFAISAGSIFADVPTASTWSGSKRRSRPWLDASVAKCVSLPAR